LSDMLNFLCFFSLWVQCNYLDGGAVLGFVLLNHSKIKMRSTYEALPSTHMRAKIRKDFSKKVAPAQQT